MFLIGCYTALRYSDLSKIRKDCIGTTKQGTKVIRIVQQKTNQQVVIPIVNEELENLLKKYGYNVPSLSEQKLNENIKEVCRKLIGTVPSFGRKERTMLTKTERELMAKKKMMLEFDKEGYPVKPRWELITCHTARRTAITNMRLSHQFEAWEIMSISGHRKEETFLKYVRLSGDEIADNLANIAAGGLF